MGKSTNNVMVKIMLPIYRLIKNAFVDAPEISYMLVNLNFIVAQLHEI